MADVLDFPGGDRRRRDDDETPAPGDEPTARVDGATPTRLARARRDRARARAKGDTLCRRGFHKWSVDAGTRFDVKAGRLVTLVRCARCDATRSELR